MKEKEPALRVSIHFAEEITQNGEYHRLRYREIEQISFYIRPLGETFVPCSDCQKKLKKIMAEGKWILGNNQYEPAIELNNKRDEIDDNSWETIEKRKATPEEIKRIGLEGWENIEPWDVKKEWYAMPPVNK